MNILRCPAYADLSRRHIADRHCGGGAIELKAQGTHVVGVYSGFIDTDIAAKVNAPKTSPRQVAEQTLEGVRTGQNNVVADNAAHDTQAAVVAITTLPTCLSSPSSRSYQIPASGPRIPPRLSP
jgi:hypothetical protein